MSSKVTLEWHWDSYAKTTQLEVLFGLKPIKNNESMKVTFELKSRGRNVKRLKFYLNCNYLIDFIF